MSSRRMVLDFQPIKVSPLAQAITLSPTPWDLALLERISHSSSTLEVTSLGQNASLASMPMTLLNPLPISTFLALQKFALMSLPLQVCVLIVSPQRVCTASNTVTDHSLLDSWPKKG